MTSRHRWVLLVALVSIVGCGSGASTAPTKTDGPSTQSTTVSPGPRADALPLGKSDLRLDAGRHSSPDGFLPVTTFTVEAGWQSAHRYDDFFDVDRPGPPATDEPLLGVVISVARAVDAAEAIDELRAGAGPAAQRPVATTLGGQAATQVDIVGGTGEVYASRNGNLALDAAPGQRQRFIVTSVGDRVVVAAVIAPKARNWDAQLPYASRVLASLRFIGS
jgi:hypothetical protein